MWLTCNVSLKYSIPYIIQQTDSESAQTNQAKDFILISRPKLITNY